MNFEEWYLKTWGSKSDDTDESNKAFYAWEACKKEVLKLLEPTEHRKFGCIDQYGNPADVIKVSIIEEIEKL